MESKLELKHIAPYLPYGLKVQYHDGKVDTLSSLLDIEDYDTIKLKIGWADAEHIWMFKPLLTPMSEIWNKEYQKQDWSEYIKYDRVKELFVVDAETSTGTMHLKSIISIMDFLYTNHFDVFGLIEQGLAIDNTLLTS